MVDSGLSLPITADIKATLKRWGAELRNQVYLKPSSFRAKTDWSPNVISSYTSSYADGTLVFANISVRGARYWAPEGGDICYISAEINFDISSGTEPYVVVPLPLPPTESEKAEVGQYIFAHTRFGTGAAQALVVRAILTRDVVIIPRQNDISTNQWTTQTNNYVIFSGHYQIAE